MIDVWLLFGLIMPFFVFLILCAMVLIGTEDPKDDDDEDMEEIKRKQQNSGTLSRASGQRHDEDQERFWVRIGQETKRALRKSTDSTSALMKVQALDTQGEIASRRHSERPKRRPTKCVSIFFLQ